MQLALALLAGLFLVGGREVRAFENAAAREIASTLQGAEKRVEVRSVVGPEALFGDVHAVTIKASHFETEGLPLFTEPERSTRGVLRTLNLELTDFTLRGLHVQSLKASIPDCRFDLPLALRHRKIRLSRSGAGPGEVLVTEKDLEQFIPIKLREIKSVRVRLDRDKVFVDGYGEFVVFAANFSVIARLEPRNGNQLVLSHARIFIEGAPADAASAKVLMDTLNPVIDLDKDLLLYGAISVDRLKIGNGELRANGLTKIPAKPS
ncbi:MAG TPA: LmeA family phospholipid-binding protein [Fimbriimonas sp.]|nr:LmeA family phospholipid-binding protein [Fimbriimonas sp.]